MAKKSYIGVSNIAHKVKKSYIGVNGVARKIKKIYLGVAGIAKQIFGGGELVYYGLATSTDMNLQDRATANAGNYLIFCAGRYVESGTNYVYDYAETYNKSLTRTQVNGVCQKYEHTGASVGNYALFAGGYNSSSALVGTVNTLNSSLTISTATSLNVARYGIAGASVGNYALFAGGYSSSYLNIVDVYSNSLTHSTATALSNASTNKMSTTVGNYAIFAGGTGSTSDDYKSVNAYNTSLTRTVLSTCDTSNGYDGSGGATTVGNYAIFGYFNNRKKTVNVFDSSLTHSTIADFTTARSGYSATTVDEFAIFAGGYTNTIEVYDSSLTKIDGTNMANTGYYNSGGTIGNYAVFTGGKYSKNVNVYTSQ